MAAAASADNRPVYAIVACVKAATARTGDAVHAFGDTAVVRGLLPSLARTIATAERAAWRIRLYLCADDTDRIYRAAAATVRRAAPPWLDLRLHFVPAEPNRVPHNACTRQAFVDGAEYIHRTNDDIVYTTVGWLTSSADALRSLDPPNVGAVGPRVYGDGARAKSLLTVDVTHRTHLLLFADYYPPQLENWFVDDWISFAYVLESAKAGSRRRSFVLGASKRFPGPWKVLHNFTHGRRYNNSLTNRKMLFALIHCGRSVLAARLSSSTPAAAAAGPPRSCRAYWSGASAQKDVQTSTAEWCANVTGAVAGMSIRPPMHRVFCRLPAGFLPSPRVAEADRAIADRETTACSRWRLWEGSGRRRRAPRVAKPWQCG